MKQYLVLSGVIAVALCGCAQHIYSSMPEFDDKSGEGMAYVLPKAVFPIKISVNSSDNKEEPEVLLEVGGPLFVGDQKQRYRLKRGANAANSDELKLSVDPETLFLTKAETKATGDLDLVLKNAAKSAAAILMESNVTSRRPEVGASLIFDGYVDPNDLQSTVSTALSEHKERLLAGKVSRARRILLTNWNTDKVKVGMKDSIEEPAIAVDCGIGVCYRNKAPAVLTILLGDLKADRVVNIPNGQPILVFPLRRPVFADGRKTDLTFVNGFLQEASLTRPSEAKEAALLPFNVIGGAIEGVAGSVLKFKIDQNAQETSYLDGLKKLSDASDKDPTTESALALRPIFCGSSKGNYANCRPSSGIEAVDPDSGVAENPQ